MTAEQHDPLTSREREILDLAERGLKNQAIADELGISKNAVRFHLKELHSKLDTGGRRERLLHWRPNWRLVALPFGFGSISSGVITGSMVAAVVVGGFAAYRFYPNAEVTEPAPVVVDGRYGNNCPTSLTTWGGQSLDYFAEMYRLTPEEIRSINPTLPEGALPDNVEVNVPYISNMTCAEATITPAGSTPEPRGTPQASRNSGEAAVTPGVGGR